MAKLAHTVTGDTLCDEGAPAQLPADRVPEPPFNVAVTPKGKADVDKLGPSLHRIAEEDPTLIVHRDETTGETIISGMGETHVEVAAEKMKRKFGVEVDLHPPRVPYRETVTTKVELGVHPQEADGRPRPVRARRDQGRAEQGRRLRVRRRGRRRLGAAKLHPGRREGRARGAATRARSRTSRWSTCKVTLFDGKEHPVDSSEMAFKLAGSQALKQGALKANPVLLEPIVTMKIRVPDANTGDVMSDLNGKRAKVHGMSPEDGGMTIIDAEAPLAEVLRYATDLRSITQGRGSFEMEFAPLRRGAAAHRAEGDRRGAEGARGRGARVAGDGTNKKGR